jgi:raffinose/stachyose/melibiose transport system permease protein
MLAVTFISTPNMKTITSGILELVGKYTTRWGEVGAGLTIATVPTLVIYIVLSKNVQRSLASGAIKG